MRTQSNHFRVLALLIPLKDKVGLLSLSNRYKFHLKPQSEVRNREESVEIEIDSLDDSAASPDRTASFTVLYGENGWGKTHLMLEACASLSSLKGERAVAILWEQDGTIFYDPGSQLKRRITFKNGFRTKAPSFRAIERTFPTVFYTTSPFEATKRRRLASRDAHDVTPSFSPDNPFEGADLLWAYSKLPQGFPFIEEAEARLRIRVPSLTFGIERLLAKLSSGPSFSDGQPDIAPQQRKALMRLESFITQITAEALTIELLAAVHAGRDQCRNLLSHILEIVNDHAGLNTGVAARIQVDERIDSEIRDLLGSVPHFRSDVPNSLAVYQYLNETLAPLSRSKKQRMKLGAWASIFERFRQHDWELLRHASSLGLVKWHFRGLSSGQVALLLLFSSLAGALNRLDSVAAGPAFIFIDEGEMFMHPAWQRRYINDLLNFVASYKKLSPNLHLILSTHSLIVAADAPPNRLFDVKAGEMTNGFGYGPKDLLGKVYHVDEFQGEYASSIMQQLVDFLVKAEDKPVAAEVAASVADQIADSRLRAYLSGEVRRQVARQNA